MSRWAKFYDKIASKQADNNIEFDELEAYLERLGWTTASEGTSHRNYTHPNVPAAVNIQPRRDGKAKSYQVEQLRMALDLYTEEDKDEWLRGKSLL